MDPPESGQVRPGHAAPHPFLGGVQELFPEGGDGAPDGDAGAFDVRQQPVGIAQQVPVHRDHGRADEQRGEELADGGVEAGRRGLGEPVVLVVSEGVDGPVEVVLHRPVGDGHGLGAAGGTRSEDHVRDRVGVGRAVGYGVSARQRCGRPVRVVGRHRGHPGRVVDRHQGDVAERSAHRPGGGVAQHRTGPRPPELVRQPRGRVTGIQGDPARPGAQGRDDRHDGVGAGFGEQPDEAARDHSPAEERGGERVGGAVEFGVREGGGAGVDGDRVRHGPEPLDQPAHECGRPGVRAEIRVPDGKRRRRVGPGGRRPLGRAGLRPGRGERRCVGPDERGQHGVEVAVETFHRRRREEPGGEVPREAQHGLVLPAQQTQARRGGGGARGGRPDTDRAPPVEFDGEPREAEPGRGHGPGARPGRLGRQQPRQIEAGEARVALALQPDPRQPLGQGVDRFLRAGRADQGQRVGERPHQPVQARPPVVAPGAGDVHRDVPLPAPPGQTAHVHGEEQMEQAHPARGRAPLQRGGQHRVEGALTGSHGCGGRAGGVTVVRQARRLAPGGQPRGPVPPDRSAATAAAYPAKSASRAGSRGSSPWASAV